MENQKLISINKTLIQACKSALAVISENSVRQYGSYVRFDRIGEQHYLVATDGYMIMLAKLESDIFKQELEPFNIPFDAVKHISKLKYDPRLDLSYIDFYLSPMGSVAIYHQNQKSEFSIRVNTFPIYRSVIPSLSEKETRPTPEINVNPKIIEQLSKIMKTETFSKMKFYGRDEQVEVESEKFLVCFCTMKDS